MSVISGAHKRLDYGPPPVRVKATRGVVDDVPLPPLLPHQTPPPGVWRGWLLLAGRGAGKTYAGARETIRRAETCAYLRGIGPTYADARDVMVEGESGLMSIARARVETWNRSLGELVFTSGARMKLFSADEPDRLRGPQSGWDWYDELAAWRRVETFDLALMGLRLGTTPQWMATTTPRPTPLIRALIADPSVVVARATTYDNPHLPEAFREAVTARYGSGRLGRQELMAELLEDTPGALWTLATIEAHRVTEAPELTRVVVGVDPKSGGDGGDGETGIVVAGKDANGRGYVLADASTSHGPAGWAAAVLRVYNAYRADAIIAEANQGGAMVEHVLRTTPGGANLPVRLVHASRGKVTRAEPIANLYAQGKIAHVGAFGALEAQMTTYVPGDPSPDHLDALVWALTELFPNAGPPPARRPSSSEVAW